MPLTLQYTEAHGMPAVEMIVEEEEAFDGEGYDWGCKDGACNIDWSKFDAEFEQSEEF
jgi:hypothetical protein